MGPAYSTRKTVVQLTCGPKSLKINVTSESFKYSESDFVLSDKAIVGVAPFTVKRTREGPIDRFSV